MTTRPPRKTKAVAEPAVAEAKRKATIPTRPVIEHTKLLRASLQVALQEKTAALAAADRDLANAASERDEAREANRHEHEMKDALADQRFDAIRTEVDADRTDILSSMTGIEAALAATEPPQAKSNVEPIRQDVEKAA